jgi:hypothetical protein
MADSLVFKNLQEVVMQKLGLIVVLAALLAVGLTGVARATDDMASDGMSKNTVAGKGVSVKKSAKKKSAMHKVPTAKVTAKTEASPSAPEMAK